MKIKSIFSPFIKKESTKSFAASLASVLIGLLAGCIIVIAAAAIDKKISLESSLEAVRLILFGAFSKGRDVSGGLTFGFDSANAGDLLFRATPLIMTGLSVTFAFKTGLFNIGAPGQYLMGTAACLITALKLAGQLSASFVWFLAFTSALIAGGLWGFIPGFLKAKFRMNEVLSCIMTNWIAANAVTWIFENSDLRNSTQTGKIGYIVPTSSKGIATAKMGLDLLFPFSEVNGGIFVAILFAVILYILLYKTAYGFENRICASNYNAAVYSGINVKRKTVASMTIAGALSAAGAALYWLSGNTEFFWSTYQSLPQEGFRGIPVALLASNNPLGIILSSLFMSALTISGQQLKTYTLLSETVTDIIIAVIIYLSAFSFVIRKIITSKGRREGKR